jgi:archaemetzincin
LSGAPPEGLTLQIVPVGGAVPPPWLARELARRFGAHTTLADPLPVDPSWVDEARGQLLSSAVVDALIDRVEDATCDPEHHWALAVADADLYAGEHDFVFGEATVGGCCAVIGLARLRMEGGDDPAVFRRRVLTEAVHELGHVAGLEHCADERCVMFFSGSLGDTDRKGTEPCQACAALLQRLGRKHHS